MVRLRLSFLILFVLAGRLQDALGWHHRDENDDYDRRRWNNVDDAQTDFRGHNEEGVPQVKKMFLKMPGVAPETAEQYLCTSKYVGGSRKYIVDFEALASMKKAHHILLFGCSRPGSVHSSWNCGREAECIGQQKILYAWAKNAPALKLPRGVGFEIGGDTGINHIVMQIHYAHALTEKDFSGIVLHTTLTRQTYIAGIFLFVSGDAQIPPHTNEYHSDMFCQYTSMPVMVPFAFRVHTHSLGKAVSAFVLKDQRWKKIGIGNPQLPQAFYPIPPDERPVIRYRDYVGARCTFSSDRDTVTEIGGTSHDEMCNFYMMYYTRNGRIVDQDTCGDGEPPRRLSLPKSASVLPANLRTSGHSHVHMPGSQDSGHERIDENVDIEPSQEKVISRNKPSFRGSIQRDKSVAVGHTDRATDTNSEMLITESLIADADWPYERDEYEDVGQVSAVGVTSKGDVVIFHRGPRRWDDTTFDDHHRLRRDIEPLKGATVYHLNQKSGKVLRKWGKDMFYLPHGLTIDGKDNVWLTDVGSHQVYKYTPPKFDVPALAVGRALIPGAGKHHFCQPADVAVEKSGVFYVADGYCNNRVMKFSPEGELIMLWGRGNKDDAAQSRIPGEFSVPHSLALDEAKKLIYVADRENGRIQCFNTDGKYYREIFKHEFGRLFAVSFSPVNGGTLYAVNSPIELGKHPQGYTIDAKTGKIRDRWSPISSGFRQPHDVCHSERDNAVFVSEIGPNRIWKFTKRVLEEPDNVGHENRKKIGVVKGQHPDATADLIPGQNFSDPSNSHVGSQTPEDDPSVIPAIVVVVVLSTPISLICFAAVVQHLRLKHKRQRAVRKRNDAATLTRDRGCMSCCYTPKYYYDSKRGFDKLIGELSDSEDDLFAKGAS